MKPVLFVIPLPWGVAIPVRAYGFMVMLGCLAAIFVALRRARRDGANTNIIWDVWMWGLVGGFIGARALYVWLFWDQFRAHLVSVLYFWEGGLAFQGGLVMALVCVYLYLKVKRLPFAKYVDIFAAALILGYAFARVGCFLNGCCHGAPTTAPWAVTYPARAAVDAAGTMRPSPAYAAQVSGVPRRIPPEVAALSACKDRVFNGRLIDTFDDFDREQIVGHPAVMPRSCPVHPTQLYSTGYALIIFAVLLVYARRPHHHGQEVSLFGMLYAVARFVVEFFRGDSPTRAGLTVFQAACLGLFALFAAAWFWCRYRMPKYEPPKAKPSSSGN